MGFCDRYVHSLHTSDLRDDSYHHQTDALQAASWANDSARGIGSLLHRVKYAETLERYFEDATGNRARLQRAWLAIVTEKGSARRWIKIEDIPTMGHFAPILYQRIADASLAHYLDGKCCECSGSGVSQERRMCIPCKGSGDAGLPPMRPYEAKLVMDMVGELMALESSHSGVANKLLRREA